MSFNQTRQNYLKISVGNDVYNLTKYDKIQVTDITENKSPNTGANLLQEWIFQCNDKNNNCIIHHFIRSTRTNSPTSQSGATNLPPFGNSFFCISKLVQIVTVTKECLVHLREQIYFK